MKPTFLRALAVCAAVCAPAAHAQDSAYSYQGVSQIFSNDWYGMPVGDRFDRWRTGSYQVSAFWGEDWTGTLPNRPFDLVELRVRAEIIAPDNLAAPAADDRLYAPALYFGASTHFSRSRYDFTLGADIAVVGDQTGLMGVHDSIHRAFGGTAVDFSDFIIEDGTYLAGTAEAARRFDLGTAELRPFVEAQAGVETLVRAGADLRFGRYDPEAMLIRDTVTGQRVVGLPGGTVGGWSFAAGADVAYVHDSVLLPSEGPDAEDVRFRVRGAVHYGVGPADLSYGVTYLSEEFVTQFEGQLVGTLSLMLRF
ncbi:lipid A-modifier LpxR family protein [Gymnodinialimonas ulvae]|uniref:lipid A-modifier LpxR family protein n=1 Tax=Gymnodinialimonas ulvae TaxID=3126504 RepID=UPI003096ED76